MSKKVRRGMHARILWPIFRAGIPEDFSNAESLTLRISRVNTALKTYVPDTHISISGNVVSFIVTAEMLKPLTSGEYRATIAYRKVSATSPTLWEPYIFDQPCFTLVDSSVELGGATSGMEIETIELNGEIGIAKEGLPGASAYRIAVANGFEGDEAEWLYSLKKPAIDAATAAAIAANAANDAAESADAATSELNTVMQLLAQSESGRVQAEQGRVNAESSRQQAEESRNIKEGDRNQAETGRDQAEYGRVQAEQGRSNAEQAREQSEASRANYETARRQAETNRSTAETARSQAEQARSQAEQARSQAEQARTQVETARTEAESDRETAENARTEAEQSRETAETARSQAEQDRGTTFTQKIEESEQATAAANTAAGAQNTYNVTVAIPLAAGSYYTKTTARSAVPAVSRKLGLVITYATADKIWYTEKYIGSTVSGWTTESNWEQVPDAAKMTQFETNLNVFNADFINAVNSLANNIGFDLGLGKKTDDTYRLLNIIGKRTGYVGYLGNYTLHGFEYTPGQNDDIVTLIGNTNYNTNKPIQSQMRPFEELISTKERFYLRDDVTKRIDGSASNLTDPNYLQKVYIPEFWYGAMYDSVRNKIQLWFSLIPVTGFMHIAPQAVCRYPGYIDGTGKARSHSGFKYPNNKNLIEFTAACQLTSNDLFVLPYYTYNALSLLLLHDIGRRNAQAVWAGLQTGSTYSNITSGKTDALTAPSGEVPADAETASNKPFRWRFIENIYGDCWKILSGVYCNQVGADRRAMVCPDPYKSNANSVISADYVQACIIAAGEGWLKDINAPWINAKAYGASSTTGYCDYTYNNTTDKTILIAGGPSSSGASAGPFDLLSTGSASSRGIAIGALFASIDQNKAATQIVKPSLIY